MRLLVATLLIPIFLLKRFIVVPLMVLFIKYSVRNKAIRMAKATLGLEQKPTTSFLPPRRLDKRTEILLGFLPNDNQFYIGLRSEGSASIKATVFDKGVSPYKVASAYVDYVLKHTVPNHLEA